MVYLSVSGDIDAVLAAAVGSGLGRAAPGRPSDPGVPAISCLHRKIGKRQNADKRPDPAIDKDLDPVSLCHDPRLRKGKSRSPSDHTGMLPEGISKIRGNSVSYVCLRHEQRDRFAIFSAALRFLSGCEPGVIRRLADLLSRLLQSCLQSALKADGLEQEQQVHHKEQEERHRQGCLQCHAAPKKRRERCPCHTFRCPERLIIEIICDTAACQEHRSRLLSSLL